ncbi:MAG: DUF4760 domain-containing protein [Candidatus Thorarchaeota archaeon]|jgi:hypothetical protein
MQLDFTQISTILGLGSVIIGIIGSLYSIRRFARARRLSIFLEFHNRLYDKEFIKDMNEVQAFQWESVDDFFEKYGPETNPDAFAKFTVVGSYFDGLSTLVRRRFIEHQFVPETTVIALINFWDKFAPDADAFAIVYRRPGCWDSIKYMYNKLHKLDHIHPEQGIGH